MELNLEQLFTPYKNLYGLGISKIIPWMEAFWVGITFSSRARINALDILRVANGISPVNKMSAKAKELVGPIASRLQSKLQGGQLNWQQKVTVPIMVQDFNNADPVEKQINLHLQLFAFSQFSLVEIIEQRNLGGKDGVKEITQKYLKMLSVYYLLKSIKHPWAQNWNSVAFILPFQGEVKVYELTEWPMDAWGQEFIYLLNQWFNTSQLTTELVHWTFKPPTIGPDLGTAYGREELRIISSMSQSPRDKAFQIMLPINPDTLTPEFSPSFIATVGQLVQENNYQVYVHSPIRTGELLGYYGKTRVANASMSPEEAKIVLRQLVYYTQKMKGKGVVIHVPKGGDKQLLAFSKNLAGVIERLLGRRTGESLYVVPNTETKIYLETPAGQGTELLTDIKDFVDFFDQEYLRDPGIQSLLGICVDTCHVFALGYDPLQYLQTIRFKVPQYPLLCHFNDAKDGSKTPDAKMKFYAVRGGRLDRHAWPGTGFIGGQRCTMIRDYLEQEGIPAVVEVGLGYVLRGHNGSS